MIEFLNGKIFAQDGALDVKVKFVDDERVAQLRLVNVDAVGAAFEKDGSWECSPWAVIESIWHGEGA